MALRNRRHIAVDEIPVDLSYRSRPRGGGRSDEHTIPDPRSHVARISRELEAALQERTEQRDRTEPGELDRLVGTYLTFDGFPGVQLNLERLESRVGHFPPQLRAVRSGVRREGEAPVESATVFLPAANDLHLWLKREQDAARAAAAMLRKQRLRPRRSSQVAMVTDPGSALLEEPAVAEDSLAP